MAKIRMGFVSNSSSSSFVVAGKKSSGTKMKITMEFDIKDYVDNTIETEDDLLRYLMDEWYGYETMEEILEDNNAKNLYSEVMAHIENGEIVYLGSVSNDSGDEISEYLHNHGFGQVDSGSLSIIRDSEY